MHSTEQLATALAGRYRIERALGAGGMATVYLAADLKHDRKVAIKVLKPELAAVLGAERFVVEIKTTAALQHPHILPLFDSGEAGGFLYYVMPYIQGETIREKLNRETQFGVDEAVRIAREVADALDYAHRHGVIHRDIKPENILLHDGRAMVMDFGIALAVSAAAGGRMTETGLSLGTPHYMSPEQATADKEITPRSDIYSLASVLYEMLAGQPPHVGGAAQQVIMKIITETARPVNQLRRNVPANVVAALEKALEKLPADRFENAKAFHDALGSGGFSYATTAGAAPARGASSRFVGSRVAIVASALAMVALGAGITGWLQRPREQAVRRMDLSLGSLVPSTALPDVAISPDGSMLAIGATTGGDAAAGIYVRRLDGDPEFRRVPGTDGGSEPAFSPDNQWIVFRRGSDHAMVKVNVNGGGAVTLVQAGRFDPHYPHWGDDGRIVFSGPPGDGIVSSSGGDAKPLPKVSSRRTFLLPDGSGVLFNTAGNVMLYIFRDDSVVSLTAGRQPVYVATGHILYAGPEGGLFAVPFDLKRHRVTGMPVRVLERVATGQNARGFSVSRTGTLVQHDGETLGGAASDELVIVDPGKNADTVRVPRASYQLPRFSHDGRRIAMEVPSERRPGDTDIYVVDLVTGTFTQLTFEDDNDEPAWSPDGKLVAYDKAIRGRDGDRGEDLYVKPADNSGPERRITTIHSDEIKLQQWIDDKTLLFSSMVNANVDIFTVSTDSGSRPVPYLSTPFAEDEPHLSPDGKLIVYVSNETGSSQLWMRDYPTPMGKWNLSRAALRAPRWAPDGKSVFFWRAGAPNDSLFRVRIDRTPGVVVHDAELVVAMNADGIQNWDLHPDGRRFVVAAPATAPLAAKVGGAPDRYLIVDNWFAELRRLMAARSK